MNLSYNSIMKKKFEIEEKMTEHQVNKHLQGNTLDLSIRHFSTIQNISHLSNLKSLNLSFNNIVSIVGLAGLNQLQKLYLEHNSIEQTKGLEKNKNLKVVNLMNNKIEKIQGFNGLIRLEQLNLSNNKISKLTGIEMQKLESLNLNNNLIESLDYMPVAPNLQELNISNNKLSSIGSKVFNNASKILRLDLSKNNLKNVKFLQFLNEIEEVNLSYNQIESINLENCFEYLQTLYLSNNKISELPYLSSLFPELMTFDISNNNLPSEITLIDAINNLDSLTNISFANNPFYQKGCEEKYSKIFKFEVVNGKQFLEAGEKFAGQINEIVEEWKQFPELYMKDNSYEGSDLADINEIKKDGFYDQELEKLLLGEVKQRRKSPQGRYEVNNERIKYQEQMFNEIQETSNRINYLKLTYRQILKKNGIPVSKSETFITHKQEVQPITEEKGEQNKVSERISQSKGKSKAEVLSSTMSQMNRITESIRAERRASVEKWKQLKSKDKHFNMRDSRRKIENKEQTGSIANISNTNERQKPNLSLPKIVSRTEKPNSKFVKTQTNHFNAVPIEKLSQTYRRPLSVKKS